MKKKLALLVLVLLITLVTATTALAGQGKGQGSSGGQGHFSLVGYIDDIDIFEEIVDDTIGTITVQTVNDRFAGQTLTVQVTSSTRFFEWTLDGREPITFGEVAVGDSTNIKGTVDADGVFFTSVVTVDVPLYCQE